MHPHNTRTQRIEEIAILPDGWLGGGEGEKINPEVLSISRTLIIFLEEETLPLPAIYPMAQDGGMSLAWRFPETNVTLRIYSPSNIELSRFHPQEVSAERRNNRELVYFQDASSLHNELRRWLKEK